jgi:hypothetical protein
VLITACCQPLLHNPVMPSWIVLCCTFGDVQHTQHCINMLIHESPTVAYDGSGLMHDGVVQHLFHVLGIKSWWNVYVHIACDAPL